MRKYCKAYKLQALRRYPGWVEKFDQNNPALSDNNIVYIWDDFTVVTNPVQNKEVLFGDITQEWQDFCANVLKFEVPEDLRYVDNPSAEVNNQPD